MLKFEFDPAKSTANKSKHGIDFIEAQALWEDANRLEAPARSTTEPRDVVIGRIHEYVWAAFVTYRHEETIRIISVRRAREKERERFERQKPREAPEG
ncbi:MAG TPA: BrnT family toxin [Vicinamibacterales bacterium]|nr:BrnT family toxin [Vicinamibacterales bacterium]